VAISPAVLAEFAVGAVSPTRSTGGVPT